MVTQSGSSGRVVDADGKLTAEGQKLVSDHMDYALRISNRYTARNPRRTEEIEAIALEALCESAASFDPSKGTKFTSFCFTKISWRIKDYLGYEWLRKKRNSGDEGLEEVAASGPPASNLVEAIEAKDLAKETADKLLGTLPAIQARALQLMYAEGQSCRDVARQLGTGKSTVANWNARNLEKLRKTLAK